MKLVINLNQNEFRLEIRQKGRVLDSETFSYYYDISEKLITSLDKLLKRNNIDATALNLFKIRGNTGKNSTSYKIAAAFVEGLRVRA
jgi:hypothetical protein